MTRKQYRDLAAQQYAQFKEAYNQAWDYGIGGVSFISMDRKRITVVAGKRVEII